MEPNSVPTANYSDSIPQEVHATSIVLIAKTA